MSSDKVNLGGIAPTSALHVESAKPILLAIVGFVSVLGIGLFAGGIYIALAGRLADTKFNLFGNQFSSTSVGVSFAFIGAVMVVLSLRKVLSSLVQLAGLPEDGPRKKG